MSKFKVTLRKNGKPVGEMSYGSEAVAVTRAKEMKEATGCEVTVAPAGAAKTNRRRAAKPRRNGATGLSKASMNSRAKAGSPARMSDRLKALGLAFADFSTAGSALYPLWSSYRSAQHFAEQTSRGSSASTLAEAREAFRQFVEAERTLLAAASPRRNGAMTMWTVRVGSQEIGEFPAAPRLTAAIARKAAKLAAEQGIAASMFKRWGSVSDGMTRHPVEPFLKNGHRCNPGCGCTTNRRRNGTAEFAFDTHFQRLYTRSHPGSIWEKAPHHKGGSPRAFLQQIGNLVDSGMMTAGTAARLRQQMRSAGFTTGAEAEFAKSNRRRNGTPAGVAAASRSLAHRAGLMWNRRSS